MGRKLIALQGVLACAMGLGAVAPAVAGQPALVETWVAGSEVVDPEFDIARDGSNCPECNFNSGTSRYAYIDNLTLKVMVGYVNFYNGNLDPPSLPRFQVDDNAVNAYDIGNGPEWTYSQLGSRLVYTRWVNGSPHQSPQDYRLGMARQTAANTWSAGSVINSTRMVLPMGSSNESDPNALVHYQSYPSASTPASTLYWRNTSVETPMPFTSEDTGMTRRWVPGTSDIIVAARESAVTQGAPPPDPDPRQVYLYHTSNNSYEQLTTDPDNKFWASMWPATDFGVPGAPAEMVFIAEAAVENNGVNSNEIRVYRKVSGDWTVVKTITPPQAETPFMFSPEPFVYNGTSQIIFTVAINSNSRDAANYSQVVMSGIKLNDPVVPLTTLDITKIRRDPEYFITANGPVVYYNRYVVGSGEPEGVYRVNTGLGSCPVNCP